jgi:tRNA(Ile)-lysidine synthase
LNLPATVESVDVRREARDAARGIEEAARETRYKFLLAVAREERADLIATGHTMSDQAETFLMRLARGAGARGLASMRPVIKAHAFGNDEGPHPLLIRPLLAVTREEVEDYCGERGLAFRTDASNASLDYARNRVRHEVLAALKQINPRVVEHISSAASFIATDQDALDALARSLLDQARQQSPRAGSAHKAATYKAAAFAGQPTALRRRMVIEAIRRERRSEGAGRAEIESKHVVAVEELLEHGMSGTRINLPEGLEVWREYDMLVFKTRADAVEVSVERGLPGNTREALIEEARREAARSGRDWILAVLDERLLPETLVVRTRGRGERALVCGQRKIKKLKNLMIDHRIPSSRRANWPIVATPDGRYIWSPGLPPAVEFAARDETQTLAILRASGV